MSLVLNDIAKLPPTARRGFVLAFARYIGQGIEMYLPVFSVFIALFLTLSGGTTLAQGPKGSGEDTVVISFHALCDEFLDAYFRTSPSAATSAGIHTFDEQLEDYTQAANRTRIAALKTFLRKFTAIDASHLEPGTAADRELVLGAIHAELLSREKIRYWQTNPDLYGSTSSNSVYVIMSRRFATAEERLKAVIARERKFPRLFQTARENLKNPPRLFTEVALEQLPGIIDFFRKDVPLAFEEVKAGKVLEEFRKTNQQAIATLTEYQAYLRANLLPRSKGDFRLGSENFRNKLRYEEMVDIPLAELLQIGWKNLRENQGALDQAVQKLDAKRPREEVLADLEKDHPAPDKLLSSVRDLLGDLRRFITEKHIVTIPSTVDPIVQETPPFMRALTFASMDTPGPFELKAKEAFYNLTLPEGSWTPQHVKEHMTGFNRGQLLSTSIHEAFPGHYVQFLWVQSAPSKIRKIFGANSNAEGWAHYTEQMMLDEGYANGDLKMRIGQLEDALLRNGRYIVGIQMHTGQMTYPQAVDFLVKEAHLSRSNAQVEAKRGTMDPTYLYYTLGKLEIMKLRADYKKAQGDKFSLQEFHDRFLKEGFPPIKLVRRLMLSGDSPVM